MDYTPSEMICTDRRNIRGINESELSTICTSHVERNNLTIRTFMRRFNRLALGFSKKVENLEAAVNLHIAYFISAGVQGRCGLRRQWRLG